MTNQLQYEEPLLGGPGTSRGQLISKGTDGGGHGAWEANLYIIGDGTVGTRLVGCIEVNLLLEEGSPPGILTRSRCDGDDEWHPDARWSLG